MTEQWVVPLERGTDAMKALLGGKGAGLARMRRLSIPTLPGFVVTTEAWNTHSPGSRSLKPEVWDSVKKALADLEEDAGKTFGSPSDPLMLSVRSSPVVSMPGQLRTILNVGLNGDLADRLAERYSNPSFAYSALARLIEMYGETVHAIPKARFSALQEEQWKVRAGNETPASAERLRETIAAFITLFNEETGVPFPQDANLQLERSIAAVFNSWFSDPARSYRSLHDIPDDQGTAVVVQQMAFGNMGPRSGSGVVFSRNPATGEKELYGEYLPNSQGEEVVGGSVTPVNISELARELPEVYDRLQEVCSRLERHYRDVQDVEFTVEEGELWILQTRSAKRTPVASLRAAVDMAQEGLISTQEALCRVDPAIFDEELHITPSDTSSLQLLAHGIQCSPGAAKGRVALSREEAEVLRKKGLAAILVTRQASADDAAIMPLVAGVLTQRGGATSHAAVVARGMGKPCVVGCEGMEIDEDQSLVRFGEVTIVQGDEISIDGSTGRVYKGGLEYVSGDLLEYGELRTLLDWADEATAMRVLVEANTPVEIDEFLSWDVAGVGLCRTERMYYDEDFLDVFREALLAGSQRKMVTALGELGRLHREEFRGLLRAARGTRLTVRLLSAPLDHFLPPRDALVIELAELRAQHPWNEQIGHREETLRAVDAVRQANPAYGLRGARLGIALPEIWQAQIESLFGAAADLEAKELPDDLVILIPFLTHAGEFHHLASTVRHVAEMTAGVAKPSVGYRVGAGIDTPRAALVADQIASLADLLCIDTDLLTNTVLALDREDAGRFLPGYVGGKILPASPFFTLDVKAVGSLIRLAVERAREADPKAEIGACGSHSRDPNALSLYRELGLDYVCCEAPHVLKARLMAGQAAAGK
jgi:pyruvate,orthophosphate dikinase